jgi:hypothetical protein
MKNRKVGIQALGSLEPLPNDSAQVDYWRNAVDGAGHPFHSNLTSRPGRGKGRRPCCPPDSPGSVLLSSGRAIRSVSVWPLVKSNPGRTPGQKSATQVLTRSRERLFHFEV